LVEATGYMVLSGKVMAFKKVCMEVFSRLTKGSFTGNFSDPHSTECSRMWKTPVSSAAGVLKVMEKALLASSFSRYSRRAPEAACVITWAAPSISGISREPVSSKPWAAAIALTSVMAFPFLRAPARTGTGDCVFFRILPKERTRRAFLHGVVIISPRGGNHSL
jgi:hypothetical protein